MNRSTRQKRAKKPAPKLIVAVDLALVETLANYFRLWAAGGEDDPGCDVWNSGEEAAPYRSLTFGQQMRDTLRRICARGRRAANDNGTTAGSARRAVVIALPVRKREAA